MKAPCRLSISLSVRYWPLNAGKFVDSITFSMDKGELSNKVKAAIHKDRQLCGDCLGVYTYKTFKKHKENGKCDEKAKFNASAPILIEYKYVECDCGLMIINDKNERLKHTLSSNHRNFLKWQERTKNATIMLCSCGLYIISSYHKKHSSSPLCKEGS